MNRSITPEYLEKRRKAEEARLAAVEKLGYSAYSEAMNQNMSMERGERAK